MNVSLFLFLQLFLTVQKGIFLLSSIPDLIKNNEQIAEVVGIGEAVVDALYSRAYAQLVLIGQKAVNVFAMDTGRRVCCFRTGSK